MKSRLFRDRNLRLYAKNNELKNKILRHLLEDQALDEKVRYRILLQLTQKKVWSSFTRVNNRCLMTSRGRGVWRNTKLSRLMFRKYALQGYLPGFSIATW